MAARLATLLVLSVAALGEAARPPVVSYPRLSRSPVLTAARRAEPPSSAQAGVVAGGLAGVALASEAIPYANTALLLFSLRQLTDTRSMVDLLDLLIRSFSRLGWGAYPAFAGMLVALQVVPLFSALVLIIVAGAIAAGPARTSLLLVLLLRLSPVMPFTFSNYLFGLTSTRLWVVFLGTLLGTLPSQTVYVSAGALGRQALQGGLRMPPAVLAVGTLAT